jgi:hypothetical protein
LFSPHEFDMVSARNWVIFYTKRFLLLFSQKIETVESFSLPVLPSKKLRWLYRSRYIIFVLGSIVP